MDLKGCTKEFLLTARFGNPGKFAIVKFPKGNCLVFCVDDVEKPDIPGFPAQGLEYFNSVEEAHKAINDKYKEINYNPMFPEKGFWTR